MKRILGIACIIFSSLLFISSVRAQDETTPIPTPTIEISPTDIVTPSPTIEVTPMPTEVPTITVTTAPSPTEALAQTGSPTNTPEPTDEHIAASVIPDTSALSLDLSTVDVSSATLTTDKGDYAPTDTAVISGTGFIPDKTYTLEITSSDPPAVDFTKEITMDSKGDFVYAYQLDSIYRPNYAVYIKDGSTVVATTTFTDTNPHGTPTPTPTPEPSVGTQNLDQCQNGKFTTFAAFLLNLESPCGTPATSQDWANGDINGQNSAYREGDAIPYRFSLTKVNNGTHTVVVEYDFTKAGISALDRLTGYNLTQASAPCLSTGDITCSGVPILSSDMPGEVAPPTSATLPPLPNSGNLFTFNGPSATATTLNAINDSKKMAAWVQGGTFVWETMDPYVTQDGLATGDSDRQFSFTFTTSGCPTENNDGCNVMLAWSGHISSANDWGAGKGASSISGAPFHMRVLSVDGSGGNQDRSVQLSALISPSTITIHKVTSPKGGIGFGFTTTGGLSPPTFSLNDDGIETFNPAPGSYTVVETDPSPTYALTNLSCTASGTGTSADTNSATASITIGSGGGGTVDCTYTNTLQTGTIELKKVWSGTGGQTTLNIGTTTGGSETTSIQTGANGTTPLTTGVQTVNAGTYYVSETGGLTNYDSSLACTDNGDPVTPGANNSLSVAATHAVVCTFTNTRKQGSIELKKDWVGTPSSVDLNIGTGAGGHQVDQELGLTTNGTTGANTVDTGTYYVSENLTNASNYDTALNCVNGQTPVSVGQDSSVAVAKDDVIVCTYTNTRQTGKIELQKDFIGTTEDVTIKIGTGQNGSQVDSAALSADGTTDENTVDTGTYYVSEVLTHPGLYNAILDCFNDLDNSNTINGGDTSHTVNTTTGAVSVGKNDDVICRYTNTYIPPLTVTKSANTTYTRTFGWAINKTVTPATWNLFKGDNGTSQYTVAVTKDAGTDSAWHVTGTISIHNSAAVAANITGVTDVISPAINATVDCSPVTTFPYQLASGGDLNCTYSADLPDGTSRTNTATVATTGLIAGGSGNANVTYGTPHVLVNDTINVTDTNPSVGPWQFSASGSVNYSKTFTCNTDAGKLDNTATITETQQSDDASVTVNCYAPTVIKDASTSLDRKWTWTIDKTADQSNLTLSPNEIYPVNYSVQVNANTPVDNNWVVAGNITVHNPAPIAATINSASDLVSDVGAATVNCGITFPYTLAAGGDLNCTYSLGLPDAASRTNTATGVLQNYSYDKDLNSTAGGTTDFTGNANVSFASVTINKIDECIAVNDTYAGSLGTVCVGVDTLPKTYMYQRIVGPYTKEVCGLPQQVNNTGSFVTNDTAATGNDSWRVNVNVACVCSLTQGYWKTHNDSFKGGAPTDKTWNKITPYAELSGFFTTANSYPVKGPNNIATPFTWFSVFQTAPKGNAYYNLAHQYMAAKLNVLNGAVSTPPSLITTALTQAETLLKTYTPAQVDAWKGQQGYRQQFINLAGVLGAFNEGTTNPAGHCSEIPVQ